MSKIITANLPMYSHELIETWYGTASVVVVETNMTNTKGQRKFHYSIKATNLKGAISIDQTSGYVTKHFTDACSYARVKARKLK